VNDLLVGFEPEGANEGHEVNRARDGRERHFEQPFTVALAKHQRTVPAALGERLCDLDLVAVLRVVLGEDLVRREVLRGHQHALGAVDDEVAAGVDGIFTDVDELVVGEAGHVALVRADHDRHPADLRLGRVDDLLGLVFAAAHDGHLHEHGRRVGDVPKPGLLGVQQLFGAVGLADARSDHPHIAEFDVDGLLALFVADIGLDRLLLVDDLLHAAVQEVVERSEVVFGEPFVREILT